MPRELEGPFADPTFVGDLDVETRLARAPVDGMVKGMFFEAIAEEASARAGQRVGRPRYVAFRGYPLAEWLEFLPEAAQKAYPALHPREGMRRFGHNAFSVFDGCMAGRVVMSMAGRNLVASVALTSRIFQVIGSHGTLTATTNVPGRAVIGLRDVWDYIDAWYVGIFEGALKAFGTSGEVRVRMQDAANGDIELVYDSVAPGMG